MEIKTLAWLKSNPGDNGQIAVASINGQNKVFRWDNSSIAAGDDINFVSANSNQGQWVGSLITVTNADFNTSRAEGLYSLDNSGGNVLNSPYNSANYSIVEIGNTGRGAQIAIPYADDMFFFRRKKDAGFGGWINLYALATTAVRGMVLKVAALTAPAPTTVTKTAPAAAATYTQADVQKMVDDIGNLTTQLNATETRLADLIAKAQAAGIVS